MLLKPNCLRYCPARTVLVGALFICQFVSSLSCGSLQEQHDRRDKAETDLQSICERIPVPSEFTHTDSRKSIDLAKVVIFKYYKTTTRCDAAGEQVRNFFIGEGWDPNRMQINQTRGGMATLDFDFRQGDYVVSVECQNDVRPDDEKKVVISCSWGLL